MFLGIIIFVSGVAVGYLCPNQIAAGIDGAKLLKEKLQALYKG